MTEVGNVYGLSLYQLAKDEALAKTIGEELSVLQEAFQAEPDFIRLLGAPNLSKAERCRILDDSFRFVKENDTCTVMSYKGNVFGVEPPRFVDLEVTSTEPGFAGNTATNTLKPATLETGAEVKVPLFIETDELIRIDTRDGSYLERAK